MKVSLSTSAKQKRNEHDNGSVHITTLDFGRLRPTYCLNVRRGDAIKMDYSQFTRLSPLVAPTFGSAKIKSYAFWVPLRTVWPSYKHFIEDSVDSSVRKSAQNARFVDFLAGFMVKKNASFSGNSGPWERLHAIAKSNFTALSYDSSVNTSSSFWNISLFSKITCFSLSSTDYTSFVSSLESSNYSVNTADFYLLFGETDSTDYRYITFELTPFGREFINTLISLGYNYRRVCDFTDESFISYEINMTALIAYFRCLYDFVYPSDYIAQLGVGYLFDDYNFYAETLQSGQFYPVSRWLQDALQLVFTPYEQDFYNSLWLQPNNIVPGDHTTAVGISALPTPSDSDTGGIGVYGGNKATGVFSNSSTGYTLTAHALQWLQAASDFITRNNIGGTRFREFVRAHTGWTSSMDDIECSQFLKSWVDIINVMDVTQTSQTSSNSLLGEQAGKGVSSGNGSLRFEAKEDGFLIILSMVTPVTAYYQGVAPWCEALYDRKDLYTEEYDSVGMEAIPLNSVWFDNHGGVPVNTPLDSIFGFAPRYSNRYKRRYDRLSGMFRFANMNVGLDSYHTFRDVMYGKYGTGDYPANDAAFKRVDNQFDRIFAYAGSSDKVDMYERFFTIFNFDVKRYSTMKSISASMPLFDKSGENVSVDYQGTQI